MIRETRQAGAPKHRQSSLLLSDVPLDAAPGSRVELQQRSGDGAARMLVRREGGWCGESGTVCDLADEVLGQYPLAVLTHRPLSQNRDLRRKSPP